MENQTNSLLKKGSDDSLTSLKKVISNAVILSDFESDLKLSKAISGTPIVNLCRTDKQEVRKMISLLVIRQSAMFSISNNLTEAQIPIIVNDLIEVFGYESMEDLIMMFKLARQGKLGKVYNRIDPSIIMGEWIPAYLEMKANERERQHQIQKSEQNRNFNPNEIDKRGLRILDKMMNKLNEDKPKQTTEDETEKPKSVVNHYALFLEKLPVACKNLSIEELEKEMSKCSGSNLKEAYKIYENELKSRTQS